MISARPTALVALVLTLAAALPGRAQIAGNAHPEQQVVADTQTENPFAISQPAAPTSPQAKHEFAQQLDLSPLRGVAVFHNGRVKVIDTLARESVRGITGKKRYVDHVRIDDQPVKLSYDPLFTWLDIILDPWHYADKPLVGVGYLPLRNAYLEIAFREDPNAQERWRKLGRITPMMAERITPTIEQEHAYEPAYRTAINRVMQSLSLAVHGTSNWLVVTPSTPDQPYAHLSSLPESHPARAAAVALSAAWRAQDPEAVNAHAAELAAAVRAINPELYPAARADLELGYNQLNAFEYGYWLYALSLVALLLAFGTGRKALVAIGIALLAGAIVLHAAGFTMRCIIAERFAIQNQFESMTGISLFAALLGAGLMVWRKQWLFGAAAAGTGFLVLITATETAIPGQTIGREAAILNTSVLLKYHVTTVLVSYGLISLGFIISLFYLGAHYAAKLRGASVAAGGQMQVAHVTGPDLAAEALNLTGSTNIGTQRTLKDLDTAQMTVLQLAFWTLGVGVLLGAWWADHSWGRWWAFDPKETWALATWIIYLIVIHLRFTTGKNRALVTAWLSVVGFVVMLWTYFGVNLLLPGLHAYA